MYLFLNRVGAKNSCGKKTGLLPGSGIGNMINRIDEHGILAEARSIN